MFVCGMTSGRYAPEFANNKNKHYMNTEELLAPLFFVVISLMAGAIMKFVLKKSSFPYTVGLFCFGIGIGILDRIGALDGIGFLSSSIDVAGNTDPNLILYIFLPLLIFDAAYEMNMHIFKKTLVNSSLLAGPGMVVAMLLTAALVMLMKWAVPGFPAWDWNMALMFGALISATDPVAVVALLKELGVSKRFSTLVDAESMLNDGTGIVLFMMFFGAYSAVSPTFGSPVVEFLWVCAGGALLGFLLARITIWLLLQLKGDALVQNSAVIFAAYITFFLAQGSFGLSGVIALVAFGLTITYMGKPRFKAEVNRFMEHFWELTAYIANTLIFIIVGIVIAMKVDFSWMNLLVTVAVYIGVNIVRAIVILLFFPLMKRCGYGLTVRESVILGWGGLRGALGLTLALMVSYATSIPEDVRGQVLFFTAGIVTLTLTVNATTTRWLLAKMGLTKVLSSKILMDYSIREKARDTAEKYYETLKQKEGMVEADWNYVREFLPEKETAPEAQMRMKDMLADMRLRILNRERQFTWSLFVDGAISTTTLRRLTGSLDELYDHDGTMPLSYRKSIFSYYSEPFALKLLRKAPFFMQWYDRYFHDRVTNGYDLGRGFIVIQKESIKMVDEFATSEVLTSEERTRLENLKREIARNISAVEKHIEKLAHEFPVSYRYALTHKAARMLLCHERRTVGQYVSEGILSEKDAEALMDSIDTRCGELNAGCTLKMCLHLAKKYLNL